MKWILKEQDVRYLELSDTGEVFKIVVSTKETKGLKKAVGFKSIKMPRQIHSSKVYLINSSIDPETLEADGLITKERGLFIGIKVADCYPVFLLDFQTPSLSVLHIGWRGAASGIIGNAMKILRDAGVNLQKLVAAIGPGISQKHYEVGEEFRNISVFKDFLQIKNNKLYLNLSGYIEYELKRFDIEKVIPSPYCTYEHDELFYSKRRDGRIIGEMLAFGKLMEGGTNLSMLETSTPI